MGAKKKDNYSKKPSVSSGSKKTEKKDETRSKSLLGATSFEKNALKSEVPPRPKKALLDAKDQKDVAPSVLKKKDGVNEARKRRLKKHGFLHFDCQITGIALDIGPRADPMVLPVEKDGRVISFFAKIIIESKFTADDLEKIAKKMRQK